MAEKKNFHATKQKTMLRLQEFALDSLIVEPWKQIKYWNL